jgi:DNA-binding MarR family transcriptional regulator
MASKVQGGFGRSPLHLLHRAQQLSDVLFEAEVGADLTPRQFAVLTAVAENEGLNQTGIVQRTGIDRSTLADLVRRLAKKGLLQRRRNKNDTRAYIVRLTDEGQKVLGRVVPLAKKVDQRIMQATGGGKEDSLERLQVVIGKLQLVTVAD